MACNLTAGRNEPCKDAIGGLQGVYFLNFSTGSFTKNGDLEITAIDTDAYPSAYYYELKGNSSYTETVNTSRDNGTTSFTQELTLNLKKLDNAMHTQLKLMAYGRPKVVVQTKNGEAFLIGEVEGAEVTAGSIQTGAALGDLYGYSITITGTERLPAAFLSGSTQIDTFGNLSDAPTVVYGTNS
jgi:hypothetical protein